MWTNDRMFFLCVCVSHVHTGYMKGEIQLTTRAGMQVEMIRCSLYVDDHFGSFRIRREEPPFHREVVAAKMQMQQSKYFIFLCCLNFFFFCRDGRHKSPNIITASWADAHSNPNSDHVERRKWMKAKGWETAVRAGVDMAGKQSRQDRPDVTWQLRPPVLWQAVSQPVSGVILRLCWNHWNQLLRFSTSATRDLARRRHADNLNLRETKEVRSS